MKNKIKNEKLKNFATNLIERILGHDLSTMASSLSYYYLSASIPLLLVMTKIISTYMEGNQELLLEILSILPETTQDLIRAMINSLINSANLAGLSIFTLIMAVWSASKGILQLLNFIKKAYGIEDKNSTIAKKITSFLYTALLIFLISLLMLAKIYGQKILELLNDLVASLKLDLVLDKFSRLFAIINGIFPLLIIALALTFLYKKAADSDSFFNISYRQAMLGGGFASVAIFLVSFIYSFFLENLSNMSLIYGALAGIIALLLQLLLFSYIIILGAEIIGAYRFVNENEIGG